MKLFAKVLLPVALLGLSGVARAAENPLDRPWVKVMEKKFPEWHGKYSSAWKALEAGRADFKAANDAWNKIKVDKAAKADDKHGAFEKRQTVLIALRKAEAAWHQWHADWKQDEIKRITDSLAKWKEKVQKVSKK